jgi:hypothetical protein
MMGVFEISRASRYDDLIAEHYHFPRIYLRAVEACVGDWIVCRETGSAGGREAYVAAGQVHSINPDPADRTLFYARISDFTRTGTSPGLAGESGLPPSACPTTSALLSIATWRRSISSKARPRTWRPTLREPPCLILSSGD